MLKDSLSTIDTIGELTVDGLRCDSLRLYAGRKTQANVGTFRVSPTAARPFTFSRVQLTGKCSYTLQGTQNLKMF